MPYPQIIEPIVLGLIVFARTIGCFWFAPGFSSFALGKRMRVGLAALAACVLVPALTSAGLLAGVRTSQWSGALAFEFVIGAAFGICAGLIIAAARHAGELIAAIAGLAPASLLDPESDRPETPLAHLFGRLALAIFAALGGPLKVVGALIEGYRVVPPCAPIFDRAVAASLFGKLTAALELTLRAAAPTALALVFASLAITLVSRRTPSLSLWSLSLAARITIGLVITLAGLGAVAATLGSAWSGRTMFFSL